MMKRLKPDDAETRSPDLVAENLEKLKALFPELVTEGKNGVSINLDVLKTLVGDQTVTDAEEKYGLNWHGKRQARQLALTPSTGTLRPCPEESVDWEKTQNLMIEGDNLEVLKLLQKSYAGKVKLIYIDPPYNTGKDFVYPDNFQDNIKNYLELTGQVDGEGRKLSSNTEASGRFHTDWLNMMYPRLRLARDLLREDGAIFVSINHKEAENVRKVCSEIFGEENFLCQFSWRTDGNFDNQAKFKICHEYVIAYARNESAFLHPPVVDPNTPKDSKLFNHEIRNTIIKNGPKNPPSPVTLPKGFPADFEEGVVSNQASVWPKYSSKATVANSMLVKEVTIESGWSSKDLLVDFIANGCKPTMDSKEQETSFALTKNGAIEAIKTRSQYQSHVISVLAGLGGPQRAASLLSELDVVFNGYPKPVEFLEYFIRMNHGDDFIVLDFFAGSGTTGHAVANVNASDAGKRRAILVQLPEALDATDSSQKTAAEYCDKIGKPRTLAEITKERLRRAGKKIRAENPMFAGDTGFRVFKLDSSNIKAWDPETRDLEKTLLDHLESVKRDRSEQDVLYELLLKLGLDLCVPVETKTLAGKTVHCVGGGALFTCLDTKIAVKDAEPLALGIAEWRKALNPASETTCVFRDGAFANDVAKTNLAEILKQHGVEKVRSL